MITYDLDETARMVGGHVEGDGRIAYKGLTIDSRHVSPGCLFIPIIGSSFDGHRFVADALSRGAAASLWQRNEQGRPEHGNFIIVDDCAKALHDLAKGYRHQLHTVFIGVTGSVGKTSTKDLIAGVLATCFKVHKTSGNYNNLLGVPQTIAAVDSDDDYAVCEMGLGQVGDMDQLVDVCDPDVTVITAIAPCHIAFFHDLDGVTAEKSRIVRLQRPGAACYFNHAAHGLNAVLPHINQKIDLIGYGFDADCRVRALESHEEGPDSVFTVNLYPGFTFRLPLLGQHQVCNALAAIGIGHKAGLTAEQIQSGFNGIRLTPHRLQLRRFGQAIVIDDAYNSNPTACAASLRVLAEYNGEGPKIAVLGDMLELGERQSEMHVGLADAFDFSTLDEVLLYGPLMDCLAARLRIDGIACRHFDDLSALRKALEVLCASPAVILVKASNGMKFIDMLSEMEGEI